MILADFSFGDLLWSIIVIFFMVVYFMILLNILTDLFRSRDLGGVAKTIWVIAILFMPLIAMLIYLIVRGGGMTDRAIEANTRSNDQMMRAAQSVVGSSASASAADQISQAKGLLDSGAINQQEFDALKAKALG